tara:strand:- start:590 stop:718 length:129 start_codon:yes stop_codon:yes gene_type:complete
LEIYQICGNTNVLDNLIKKCNERSDTCKTKEEEKKEKEEEKE